MKILKHGIRHEGKYIRAAYRKGPYVNLPEDVITVYAGAGERLPKELNPENDSDGRSDYFEDDRARIYPDHPLYNDFLKHVR